MDPTSDLDATTIWWILYTRAEDALTAKKKDDLSSHCEGTRRKATSRNWKLAALDFHYTILKVNKPVSNSIGWMKNISD